MGSAEEFTEFAATAGPRLRRTAFLLCGDWHTAEDLVQTALAKVFVSWRRIREQNSAHAYATRTLVNTYLADKRLKRPGEVLTGKLPDRPAESEPPPTSRASRSRLASFLLASHSLRMARRSMLPVPPPAR